MRRVAFIRSALADPNTSAIGQRINDTAGELSIMPMHANTSVSSKRVLDTDAEPLPVPMDKSTSVVTKRIKEMELKL